MRESLFGHRVTPGIAKAVASAKGEFLTQGKSWDEIPSRVAVVRLTEEDQLNVIEEFGEMFGEHIHTMYSQRELREWVEATANRIVHLLGQRLALQENKKAH